MILAAPYWWGSAPTFGGEMAAVLFVRITSNLDAREFDRRVTFDAGRTQ